MSDRNSNTAIWIVIYLAIVAATTAIGLLIGGLYYWMTPAKFHCKAAFRLAAHPAILDNEKTIQHERLISEPEFVKSVFDSKKLLSLRCFDDLSKEQALKDTIANLKVVRNIAEPSIYEVTLVSNHPDDARLIADNLIASYGKKLETTKAPAAQPPAIDPQSDVKTNSKHPAELLRRGAGWELVNRLIPTRKLELFEPATYGEPVWPILPVILAITGLTGVLAGFVIILAIFLISRGMTRQTPAGMIDV